MNNLWLIVEVCCHGYQQTWAWSHVLVHSLLQELDLRICKRGSLWKTGGDRTGWKKRFCTLDSDSFKYFKDESVCVLCMCARMRMWWGFIRLWIRTYILYTVCTGCAVGALVVRMCVVACSCCFQCTVCVPVTTAVFRGAGRNVSRRHAVCVQEGRW